MDIAIRLESINLGNERIIFKPIGIIKGVYDKTDNVFIDEYACEYEIMQEYDPYNSNYFCNPISIKKLKKDYPEESNEFEIIWEYLLKFQDIFYVGYYEEETDKINIFDINFQKLEVGLSSTNPILNNTDLNLAINDLGLKGSQFFMLDMDMMNALRESESLEEVREFIDELIDISNQVSLQNSGDEKSSEVQTSNSKKSDSKKLSLKKEESKKFDLIKLRKEVLDNVIGQDEAVYDLTRVIGINLTSQNPRNKSHILITGPAGTGKTEMVKIVAKELDLPVFKAAATQYSKTGYEGESVSSMLVSLYQAANGDLEKAQNGILIIDEIDKTVTFQADQGFGKAVLHELLKILDRDVIQVELDKIYGEKLLFDTSNLTVIMMGSFTDLYESKQKDNKSIGFNSSLSDSSKVRLTEEDLIKWMGPEFVGRVDDIVSTDELSKEDVLKILKYAKGSQLRIAKEDLANRGKELIYTTGYVNEIAKNGYNKKTGARNLNKEVKKSLRHIYDEVLTNPKVKKIKMTKATALDSTKYFVE